MSFSKRKRYILITSVITVLFVAVIYSMFFRTKARAIYIPGEQVQGVTSVLQRPVPKDHPKVVFTDVTKRSGIHFRHFWGSRTTQLPEDMGSGAAWIDYDQDGYPDLFIVNEAGPLGMSADSLRESPARCVLYHNNGDGTFTNVTKKAGINFKGWGMGVAVGDADNDGWPDIFITAYAPTCSITTMAMGPLPMKPENPAWAVSKDSGPEPAGLISTGMGTSIYTLQGT